MNKNKKIIIFGIISILIVVSVFVFYGAEQKRVKTKDKEFSIVLNTQTPSPATQTPELKPTSSQNPEPTSDTNDAKQEIKTQKPVKTEEPKKIPTESPAPIDAPIAATPKAAEDLTQAPTEELFSEKNTQIPEENDELTCTLSIRCDTILENIENLKKEKKGIVPENGIILSETEADFENGDSIFDVLKRETKKKKIHFEFVYTPMYDSVYIEGINNLYEMDCGDGSGWLYKVNGTVISIGCSQYKVKDGDKIELIYTCKMGNDI